MKDPELVESIAAADPERAAILRSFPADVVSVLTPFYRSVRVVDIDVETYAGKLRYRYGLEGDRVVALGERPDAVYELNDRDGLTLGRDSVRAYVRFFFDSVGGRKMRIVERAEEVRWRPRAPEDPRPEHPKSAIKPISTEPLPGAGYRAVATATWDIMLVEIVFEVSPEGRVRPTSQRLLEQHLDIIPTDIPASALPPGAAPTARP